LYVNRHLWRNPQERFFCSVLVLGVNPRDKFSKNQPLTGQRPAIAVGDTVLIDDLARPEFGRLDTGSVTQIGSREVAVVGQFEIGPGFDAGLIVVSDQTFSRLYGGWPLEKVNLGLIRLRPGDRSERAANEVAATLRQGLPADVQVLTRHEIAAKEREHWVKNTSTGIIFGSGVVVAFFFGIVIIYQVLSMEVQSRLAEYATLKAMGFTNLYLWGLVLKQAVVMAVLSYVPAYVIAVGIYDLARGVTNLPVEMTGQRAVVVFFLNLAACCLSGLVATRILRKADPVELFLS
jgi:putative ABC transport system permease protein